MKLDPRHLEILAAIVDSGGLTDGAEALGKSQPSVSRTLSQLEARVGAPLFVPGKRPLQPTDLGLALAEQGRLVLKADRAASDIVTRFRAGRAGMVRVGGTPIFMDGVIAAMIARFQQQTPDVAIEQTYGYADQLIERLRARALDIAITPLRPSRVPDDLDFRPILKGMNVIACRREHPLTRRKSVTQAQIAEFPWIAPPVESPLYKDLRRALRSIGAEDIRISFTGGSLASVMSVLTGSDSLTVLPYSVVFMMKEQVPIAALALDIGHPDRELGLLVSAESARNPAAERLHAFVAGRFDSLARTIVQHRQDRIWR